MTTKKRSGLLPPLLYLGLSLVLFGRPVIDDLGSAAIGSGTDPSAAAWFLKWWPLVLANGWNPLHTDVVYVPDGFNMMWAASMPGPSALLAPITQLAGPLPSYNVMMIVAPALNAWAAYLFCRALAADYVPSLVGGFVFGFSSYVLGHIFGGHPMLALVAFVPLSGYLVLQRVHGRISRRRFLILLSLTLTFQFLTSTETFLLLTMLGGAAFAGAHVFLGEWRPTLRDTLKWLVAAYAVTFVLVSPLLYKALSEPNTLNAIDPVLYGTDPLNLVIPTELTGFGGDTFLSVSARFSGNPVECGAYFGLPLLIAIAIFAFQNRRRRAVAILPLAFAVSIVASLGARLTVLDGVSEVRLPWAPMIHLPIFEYVVPLRLTLFAWLPAAAMLALWLSTPGGRWPRFGLAALVVASLLPSLSNPGWSERLSVPPFFDDGRVEKVVGENATLLVLPYPPAGDSQAMLWHAEADMRFSMVGGYISATVPASYACWPVAEHARSEVYGADVRPQVPAFLASKQVDAVVASPAAAAVAAPLRLSRWLGPPTRIGGMLVYRVPNRIKRLQTGSCPPGYGF